MASSWVSLFRGLRSRSRSRKIQLLLLAIFALFILYFSRVPNKQHSEEKNSLESELEFQTIFKGLGIPIFLVEPRWLIKCLTEEDMLLLKRREIDVATLSRSNNLTTYGIFEEDSIHINQNLVQIFRFKSYSYSRTEASDARLFNWHEKINKNVMLTSHHFFAKNNHVFHLVVFYKRRAFLWISPVLWLPAIVSNVISMKELLLGGQAAAFESFQIKTMQHKRLGYFIKVPSDVRQFLSELPFAKFLECNHKVSHQFHYTYVEKSKSNEGLNQITFNAISAVKNVLKPFIIPFWIASGTLLGWYRQCDIIPYTSDVDLAGWARDIDSSLDAHVLKNQQELILRAIYGIHWESYQYVFTFYNLRVDFFFTYKDDNNYWYGGHGPGHEVFFHYNYPKFTLCSGELVGQKVLVPCNPESVISAEYGKAWFIPVEEWSYVYSPFNVGTMFHWPKELINKTHIYL